MTLSTQVAVLYNGEVQQLAPPSRIYSHPANQFVAGFIGSPQMNLLTLNVMDRAAQLGNTRISLPEKAPSLTEVVLGIRPEHIDLAEPGDASSIQGTVYLVEHLGMSNLLSVRLHGSETQTLRVMLPSDQPFSDGEISLKLPPDQIHWFEVKTGDRL